MEFTWSEHKRAANLRTHGLDFVDATRVFEGMPLRMTGSPMVSNASSRWVCLPVFQFQLCNTETDYEIRVISFRKATNREAKIYFNEVQN